MLNTWKKVIKFEMLFVFLVCVLVLGDNNRIATAQEQNQSIKQDQKDESRDIYFDYSKSRKATSAKRSANRKRGTGLYRRYIQRTVNAVPAAPNTEPAQLGVTIWRARPSIALDSNEIRILEQEDKKKVALTPVRINGDALLNTGDRVRLSIESPRVGYLYVINRELYSDGTMSDPFLIFPNKLTRGGENRVEAGELVDIPADGTNASFFRMKPSRADQTAEVLTMLITTEPLEIPPLEEKFTALNNEQFKLWEKMWSATFEQFEMEGGEGQTWTNEEKSASYSVDKNKQQTLAREDAGPQTIFRGAVKRGNPLFITVPLRYAPLKPNAK